MNTVSSTIFVSPVGSKMDVREVLLLNVLVFNIVTCVADKSIDGKEVQPLNADMPMIVTPEGINIEVRVLQLRNTESPILRSPEGRLIDDRAAQPLNADMPMIVTPEGIIIEVRVLQPWNTESPILRSPDGILTDVSEVQPLNELASIVVTPVADILMDRRSIEFRNTLAFIAVTSAPRVTFAGMGPVKPTSTPSTILGPVGIPNTGVHLTPSPIVFSADTEIE